MKTRVGIVGYGNLGKAVLSELKNQKNREQYRVVGVFSRRQNKSRTVLDGKIIPFSEISSYRDKIDLLFLCVGSKDDLTNTSKSLIKDFNLLDAYDNHAKIKNYHQSLDALSETYRHTAIICCGWDPGLFSTFRAIIYSVFDGANTLFGRGISQGHSNAIKSFSGVKDATAVTIPKHVKKKKLHTKVYSAESLHKRLCFVGCAGKDKNKIKNEILSTKDYFSGYKTKLKFRSEKTVRKKRGTLYHAGKIFSVKKGNLDSFVEIIFKTKSNPTFTAKMMIAYSKALIKKIKRKEFGAFLPTAIPPCDMTDKKNFYGVI